MVSLGVIVQVFTEFRTHPQHHIIAEIYKQAITDGKMNAIWRMNANDDVGNKKNKMPACFSKIYKYMVHFV